MITLTRYEVTVLFRAAQVVLKTPGIAPLTTDEEKGVTTAATKLAHEMFGADTLDVEVTS